MSLDLRPLTLGELLDRSFSLYRHHFSLFVGLMAVPSVFTLLVGMIGQILPEAMNRAGVGAEPDPISMLIVVAVGSLAFVIFFIGYLITYMITLGATTVAVSELHVGRTATIASAYSHVRSQIGRLLLLMLAVMVRLAGVFIGLMLIVVVVSIALAVVSRPGGAVIALFGTLLAMLAAALFGLRYALSVPALVLEQQGAGHAIRRSVALTRGNLGRTALIVLFAMIISWAGMAIFQGPFMVGAIVAGPETSTGFWLSLAGAVTGTIGGAITGPLMIIALALLYYDVRIRNEGLDMQLMLAGLDAEPITPAPVG
jgi:Membrane domain of glycerophosphoryl diester phosphodiesterase